MRDVAFIVFRRRVPMQGVRLGRTEILARFGVSQRLAVRIGALLAKRIDLTAAILESAQAANV